MELAGNLRGEKRKGRKNGGKRKKKKRGKERMKREEEINEKIASINSDDVVSVPVTRAVVTHIWLWA